MRVGALAAAVAIGCTAPSIEVAPSPAAAPAVTLEVWNPWLVGWSEPTRAARAKAIAGALAADTSVDVVCLRSVPFDEDRQAILDATKVTFPHVGYVRTDRATPIDDPRDLTGVARTVPTTPPCSTADDIATVEAVVKCHQDCRDGAGVVDAECVRTTCASLPVPAEPRCRLCAWTAVQHGPLENALATCRDVPRGELAADGRLGTLILSRHRLEDVRAYIFPSTMMAHGALTATVRGDEQAAFSVACSTFDGYIDAPYAGVFGAPDPDNPVYAEVELNLQNLLRLGIELGARRRTFLLGGGFLMWDVARTTRAIRIWDWDFFATNFQPLIWPADLCTVCRDNPLVRATVGATFPDHVETIMFATGTAPTVEWAERARTETTFTLDGQPAPLSPVYAMRARVQLP